MFQPELRKMIESLGKKRIKFNFLKKEQKTELRYSDETIDAIVESCALMSEAKTGALILIEREIPLTDYEKSGININSDISSQLIVNIFEKNTPLHDGAMIIKNNKISAATCYLPLSDNKDIDKKLGTRHRAGIGASEETDALIIMVSEETGRISIAEKGTIEHHVNLEKLRETLEKYQNTNNPKEEVNSNKTMITQATSIVVGVILWCTLMMGVDPTVTVDIKDIPVEVVNDNILIDTGNTYTITDGDKVNISVTGRKSDVSELTKKDFKATADFDHISISNSINIDVVANNNSDKIKIDTHNALMEIEKDESVTIDCPVKIIKNGKEKDGYYACKFTTDIDSIKVTGPKKVINKIDCAQAIFNVNNIKSDRTSTLDLSLYDKNGDIMDISNCTLSNTSVQVKCKVNSTKTVPFNVTIVDDTGEIKVNIISQEFSTDEILISGNEEVLDDLKTFDIKLKLSDFQEKTTKIKTILDLKNYLPSNLYIAQENTKLEIILEIQQIKTQTLKIPKKNVIIKGGKCKILEDTKCEIQYDINEFDNITIEQLKPYIDISSLSEGEQKVKISFENDKSIKITTSPQIKIKVER